MNDLDTSQLDDRNGDDAYPVDDRGYTATPGAAKYADLSESYLNKARHFGTGPEWVTFGSAVRYSFAALDAWAAKSRKKRTRDEHAEAEK